MPHVNIKGVGTAQFPDDMPINDIRAFLQKKFTQDAITGNSNVLAPAPTTAAPFTPTLTENIGQGVSDFLTDTGIISNRHGAQQIGKNIAAIGEFLPGIGDAAAGDEFGRAVAQGDTAGIALGALSAIPVVGKAAKKGVNAGGEFIENIDFTAVKNLPFRDKAKLASEWQTGQPIKLNFARNKESSKNFPAGMDFGQKLEPAGRYMNVDFDDKGFNKNIPNWEFGEIEFSNPIVLEHKSTNSTGWKKDLSEMFGGSTGKRLTNKIKKAGHDGIITRDADGFNETISIK